MVMYKGVAKKKGFKRKWEGKKGQRETGEGGGMLDDTFKMKVSRDWE